MLNYLRKHKYAIFITPAQQSCWGILVSLRLSIRLSCMACPLYNTYSCGWTLSSILGTNDDKWSLTSTYIFKVIQHSLFHTPTGSAHRSVHGGYGFTKKHSDCLTCVRLWCTDVIVTYSNKHREYCAINVTSAPKCRKQKAFPFQETAALWVFWKSREFSAFFRGHRQSYAHRHGMRNSLNTLIQPWIYNKTAKIWHILCPLYLKHVEFWMDSFHMWHKWSLAWEGVSCTMTFDINLYLQGHSAMTLQ